MQLTVELESEPIAGSISVDEGAPKQFSGWIELVATIESARQAASSGAGGALGVLRGASAGAM